MITKVVKTAALIFFIINQIPVRSQSIARDYPVIGEPMPELQLNNVHYYSKKTFNPKELKGKWIILDFWYKGCTACVQTFPKVNQLQNEFKDNIQFMLVSPNDKRNSGIEQIYARYTKTLGLQLPIAYDSAIIKRFGISGFPHVIVIDPQTNVYAITGSDFLTQQNLQDLIEDKQPVFRRKEDAFEQSPYQKWNYSVDKENLNLDFVYRSILSKNKGEMYLGSVNIEADTAKGFYQNVRIRLSELYNIAYWGISQWSMLMPMYRDYWEYPILEIRDSSLFQYSLSNGQGFYNYSLIVPREKATKTYLMEVMQSDLKNYFGYEVSIETRMMPFWKLTATEAAKENLKTRSKVMEDKREPLGIKAKKISLVIVLAHIKEYNADEQIPFINETGIKGPIDISYDAVMTDMVTVVRALKRLGLILEKSKREMKVLVIRDPPTDIKLK